MASPPVATFKNMIQIWSVHQVKADIVETAEFTERQLRDLKHHSVPVKPQIMSFRPVCRCEWEQRYPLYYAPFLTVHIIVENSRPSVRRQYHLIAVR